MDSRPMQHVQLLRHAGGPTSRAICQAGRLLKQEQVVSCRVQGYR